MHGQGILKMNSAMIQWDWLKTYIGIISYQNLNWIRVLYVFETDRGLSFNTALCFILSTQHEINTVVLHM